MDNTRWRSFPQRFHKINFFHYLFYAVANLEPGEVVSDVFDSVSISKHAAFD